MTVTALKFSMGGNYDSATRINVERQIAFSILCCSLTLLLKLLEPDLTPNTEN
jgi:hypothetical protein